MSIDQESQQPVEMQDDGAGVSESPGQILERARLQRGLDEKEVADQLHITVHYVKAIEADKYEKLPGAIFAKGYVKSYAELLGLDSGKLLDAFAELQAAHKTDKTQISTPKRRSRKSRNTQWAFASAAAFVVLLGGAWWFATGDAESGSTVSDRPAAAESRSASQAASQTAVTPQQAEVELALPPAQEPVTTPARDESASVLVAPAASTNTREPDSDAVQEDAVAMPAPVDDSGTSMTLQEETPTAPIPEEIANINVVQGSNGERIIEVDAQGQDVLRISFSGASWVEVNDGDARQIYRDLREAGDILEITGEAPFNILLGDAPLTSLRFNGSEVDVSEEIRIDNSARLTVGL